MRWAFVIVWCLLLAGGLWWSERRSNADADFVAVQDLPVDHWIRPGDIAVRGWRNVLPEDGPDPSVFDGRYVLVPLKKDKEVPRGATGSTPNLTPGSDKTSLVAALKRDAIDDLNAGSCVQLNVTAKDHFVVRTILCPNGGKADCAAIVDVPLKQWSVLGSPSVPLAVAAKADCK